MEIDVDIDIRSIDLSKRITTRFNKGYNTNNEIESFYQVVHDIDKDSVDDDNCYEWRKGGDNIEEDLPALEPAPFDDELESDIEKDLSKANITVEDIVKMHAKHLKEHSIVRSFITAGNE